MCVTYVCTLYTCIYVKMIKLYRWRIYIFVALICFLIISLNILILSCLKTINVPEIISNKDFSLSSKSYRGSYVVYGKDIDSGYLRHVFDILDLYGYKRVSMTETDDWDLMWAHEYPFKNFTSLLRNLLPHQKVNHFPGSGFITNKMDLSTSDLPFTPKAFKLPMQRKSFFKYVSEHPGKKYVVKSNDHRGIKILEIEQINFNEKGIFLQEYIDDPLLVDGYKFDIGVYTIITSLDPLRVYIYDGDTLFRYCTEKYHPFDPSKTDKYVIGDDYLPTWEVPSLKKYYTELGFSMKTSFNAYMIEKGYDYKKIWRNIEDSIRVICNSKEPYMLNILKSYNSKNNFFELMRFDFVVDSDLNVYLMEVNMSPNLSSLHFRPNRLLYEQVLFNLFSLVGLGIPQRIGINSSAMVAEKNIVLQTMKCRECAECSLPKCQLCLSCLSKETITNLKRAYLEHMNKGDCKRIFPCDWEQEAEKYKLNLSSRNKLFMKWYEDKCKEDSMWCC